MKDEALTPQTFKMEELPIARPHDSLRPEQLFRRDISSTELRTLTGDERRGEETNR